MGRNPTKGLTGSHSLVLIMVEENHVTNPKIHRSLLAWAQ